MKGIRRVALAAIIALSCIVFPQANVLADDISVGGGVVVRQPRWSNAQTVSPTLSFSGTTANCNVLIVGKSGTSKISATITLQRKVNNAYTDVKTWTESASGSMLNFSGTQIVTSGYTYRLSVSATVTKDGLNESVSAHFEKSL